MGTYQDARRMHRLLAEKRAGRLNPSVVRRGYSNRPWLGEGLRGWPTNLVLRADQKQHSADQAPVPVGYRDTRLELIPHDHVSSKSQQDYIEASRRAEIQRTPAGPRRKYLEDRLEWWRANGRPTFGGKGFPKQDQVKTWKGGATPLAQDFSTAATGQPGGMEAPENRRLIRRMLGGKSGR